MSFTTTSPPAPARAGASPEALGRAAGLAAATMWGATIAMTRLGVAENPTALVSLGSTIAFLPFSLLALESGLVQAGWAELALHAARQGGVSGLAAPAVFAAAGVALSTATRR
jgi:hypothetical protein